MAAATTATRSTSEMMWSFTIDCRYDTFIEGITRYQCPRIIAVQVPPSSAAEVRKLATVSAVTVGDHPLVTSNACRTTVKAPAAHATATIADRTKAGFRRTSAH